MIPHNSVNLSGDTQRKLLHLNIALSAIVCTPWYINSRVSSQAEAERGILEDR